MSFDIKMLWLYWFVICFAGPAILTAQDSIRQIGALQVKKEDTNYIIERIKELNFLKHRDPGYNNPDSVIQLCQEVIDLSEKLGFIKGKADVLSIIGDVHTNSLGKKDFQAVQNYNRSIALYEQIEGFNELSEVQINLGHIYLRLGDKEKAEDYFAKSLENAKKTNDLKKISGVQVAIAQVYLKDEDTFDQGIEKWLESIKISEQIGDTLSMGVGYMQIGALYLSKDMPQKAIPYLDKSREYFQGSTTPVRVSGDAHLKLNQYQKAKYYYQQVLEDPMSSFGSDGVLAYVGLGKAELASKRYASAIAQFKKALDLNKEIEEMGFMPVQNLYQDKKEALEGLIQAYSYLNDFRNGFLIQQELNDVQKALIEESKSQKAEMSTQIQALHKNDFEIQNKEFEAQKKIDQQAKTLLYIGLGIFVLIALGLTNRFLFMRKAKKRISEEKQRSDEVLLNILPEETAEELKANGLVKAKKFDQITVLFTDFKEFSLIAENETPENLVASVDYYFRHFDTIIEKYGLEKIKTIGDAYMCAGGIPRSNETHAEDAMKAAIEIRDFVNALKKNPPSHIRTFEVRIGLNSGPVVAGVVGIKKFAYDIWGSTVNFAARMESNSEPGRINVSESTFELLKDRYNFKYRGNIEVKNGQTLKMYFAEL